MSKKLRIASGLVLAIVAVFLFTASVSYLLHWREDMSLLAMGASASVSNVCGKAGAVMGDFLIRRCFGLASFLFYIILAFFCVNILRPSRPLHPLKSTFLIFGSTFLGSILFALVGIAASLDNIFGGGPGGLCGAYIGSFLTELTGEVFAILITVVIIVCFLILCSDRFTSWFTGLFSPRQKSALEREDAPQNLTSNMDDFEDLAPERPAGPAPVFVDSREQFFGGMSGSDAPAGAFHDGVFPSGGISPNTKPTEGNTPAGTPGAQISSSEGTFEIVSEGDTLSTKVYEELPPIDNRMDVNNGGLPKFKRFSLDLLADYKTSRQDVSTEELQRNNNRIRSVLSEYKVQINDVKALVGPTVTLYKVYPASGVKIADIKKLQEDIAIRLGARGVRVVTLSDCVGIEVANDYPSIVPLKALLNSDAFKNTKAALPVAIGYTITREVKVFDLTDAPHLLVAGATKQGKSVGLNVLVGSLLYHCHPSELKFVFIDPKMVEFSSYASLLHHYLAVLPEAGNDEQEKMNAIVKKPQEAEKILRSLCIEMDDRYTLLNQAGVNNVKRYNEQFKARKLRPDKGHRYLPYLVVIVDEYADLTMMTGSSPEARNAARSITTSIVRLAQKGRAAGLHVVLATQRPSVDVISGMIKSNFPMRIAFRVSSRVDSQTILDNPGAEKLIGNGDMLLQMGIDSERIQCGYVDGKEIDKITDFIEAQQGYGKSYNTPYYLPLPADATSEAGGAEIDMTDIDEKFEEAARLIVTRQKGSTSDIQRRLGTGYAKAGKIMDQLEGAGIVGPQEGSKPREVLVPDLDTLEQILRAYRK